MLERKHKIVTTLLGFAALGAAVVAIAKQIDGTCQLSNDALQSMEVAQVQFAYADGTKMVVNTRLADNDKKRAAGFQNVCASTIAETPILFVFPRAVRPSFHMNNVVAEIDIAFIDAKGRIDSIQYMQPYILGSRDRPLYRSTKSVVLALETHPGFYQQHNIDQTVAVSWSRLQD